MKPHRTIADREDVLGAIMLAPSLVYVILLVGVPFAFAILLSFSDATAGSLHFGWAGLRNYAARSEEHTSELQSQSNLVCRLLLEKKKNNTYPTDRAI